MASELENAIKSAAEKVAQYISDAATLTVETRFVEIGADGVNFDAAKPIARSIIKLDGDSSTVIPMRKGTKGQTEVDTALYEIHQNNVNTAIEYRAKILNAVLGTLKPGA